MPNTKNSEHAQKEVDLLAKQKGKWEEPFSIENVACHATLLPNGKILCWSRRSNPMSPIADMNEQRTNAFLIDLEAESGPRCTYTGNQPQSFGSGPSASNDSNISLFCSGHCLLSDGNVFVVGGHIRDGVGQDQACVYDYGKDLWSAKPPPGTGRWYPSALSLPNSSVLAISGSSKGFHPEQVSQVWRGDQWDTNLVQSLAMPGMDTILSLYPRLHLQPNGRIFMTGPGEQSLSLDLNVANTFKDDNPANGSKTVIGQWGLPEKALKRNLGGRENGASVTYDVGKVLWVAGGNGDFREVAGFPNKVSGPPTEGTEFIDFNAKDVKWVKGKSLNTPRRQHNLTTLPDGTVLVTGGTRGLGFNDLRSGKPVHTAELWDPTKSKNPAEVEWEEMAEESTDRCYHGVALLLPDGSVFSAGGGEGGEFDAPPNPAVANPARDNHTNAQIYKPPYFFTDAELPRSNDSIKRISWIRLPSVTHGLNSSQSVFFEMPKIPNSGKITVTPPTNRNVATPGHYMLFSKKHKSMSAARSAGSLRELDRKVVAELDRPAVKVGLTPVCPYGLGPCWGGAYEGLHQIQDIDVVRPLPDQANSVAYVHLKEDILPDIDVWRKELAQTTGGTYDLRGIELQVTGMVKKQQVGNGDGLILSGNSTRPDLVIEAFKAASKLERDHKVGALMLPYDHELRAYDSLLALVSQEPQGTMAKVTGRLHKQGENEFSLDVKEFEVVNTNTEA
ncbi:galactose oxidase precursor [Venturia nashicola]|nr:galactose oxidase precursor [Venturia nashicola]